MPVLLTIGILLISFYSKQLKAEKSRFEPNDIILIISAGSGAFLTYFLNTELNLGVVLAAGITGLLSSFIPFINRRSDILRELPVSIYCGAFAGMTSPLVAQGYWFIILAGLLSGIILVFSKSSLHGFGGKLGTVAFGGVSIISLIIYLVS